jgi:cysteine desulfurase
MIYLDNNATTRPRREVVAAIAHALDVDWANPSSSHGWGQRVSRAVTTARAQVAGLLNVREERVVFTSGATEANEAVLRHYASIGASLITSSAEHPSIGGLYTRYTPDRVHFVPLDSEGRWKPEGLEKILAGIGGPKLIALALANGETGVLQDNAAIEAVAARHDAACLVDASQVLGRLPVSPSSTAYTTFSGHKLHGPKGVGALIQPRTGSAVVVAVGGGQEMAQRGGTPNVPGIIGLGVACELAQRDLSENTLRMMSLRDDLEAKVIATLPDTLLNGASATRLPNTTNLTFPGVDGMALVARMETRSVLCSQVSACSSGQPEPSRALLAMGRSREDAFSSVRFAVSIENTHEEIAVAAQALAEEVRYLREIFNDL